MHLSHTVTCPIHRSFRVEQVAGMFDLPLGEKATQRFDVELPDRDERWEIGLIVGPSGSGKSTIARQAFDNELYQGSDWPADRAVIDCFGDLPVRQVVELLTAVGFSSPPSWVKPYAVLSNGERFRCDLARALARGEERGARSESRGEERGSRSECKETSSSPLAPHHSPLVVFDEYTSVVDRNVARVASAAIAKGIRAGRIPYRFVAVTCHYDVAEWLEPDWTLDMATCSLSRRRLRRPSIELEIHRCRVAAWQMFARHHYLSGEIHTQARCYLATWNGVPVSFAATLPLVGRRNHRRFTRIVTLPDYQGIGIGMRVVAAVAGLHREEGLRVNVTSSHPALIQHCKRSPLWKAIAVKKPGARPRSNGRFRNYRDSGGRGVVSFEYVGKRAIGCRLSAIGQN